MVYDDCEGFKGHVWLVLLGVIILMLDGEGLFWHFSGNGRGIDMGRYI